MKKFLLFLFALIFLNSCKKESDSNSCSLLREGISNSDETKVQVAIENFINSLPSQQYTRENFEKLAGRINESCNITIVAKCFDCVQTLPTQSELTLAVNSLNSIQKTVDLSYDGNHKMKFVRMH